MNRIAHFFYHLFRGRSHQVTINWAGQFECTKCGWEHGWDFPKKGW